MLNDTEFLIHGKITSEFAPAWLLKTLALAIRFTCEEMGLPSDAVVLMDHGDTQSVN